MHDPNMTETIYLPLIQLLQKTDLTPWLSALNECSQAEDDKVGGFSLFD